MIIVFQQAFYSNEMSHFMIKVPTVYPPFWADYPSLSLGLGVHPCKHVIIISLICSCMRSGRGGWGYS